MDKCFQCPKCDCPFLKTLSRAILKGALIHMHAEIQKKKKKKKKKKKNSFLALKSEIYFTSVYLTHITHTLRMCVRKIFAIKRDHLTNIYSSLFYDPFS